MAARGRAAGSEKPGDIMKGTVRTALILLLIPLCAGQTTGQCPPQRYMSGHYPEGCPQLCEGDSSCPGNKKCCPDSCYTFCKPPAKVRPGSCPPPPPGPAAERCDDTCTSDSECADGSKCCHQGCGLTCVPSVREKRGFCGAEVRCFVPERSLCGSDTDCTDDEKCCHDTCRAQCRKPLQERAGQCPRPAGSCPVKPKTPACKTDQDCPKNNKCCTTPCGKQCVWAVYN
ncbi:uncharacterized protein LOC142466602 isoform X2 [Ascaphus truei]|uniref:uncharacterized protein LOC142466602 isoform X2 n=1 Tax=Ascaphus truei TaxID=8439 RepID=UPI003F599951